eukprot:NODE_3700_length_1174_cov_55.250238_g3515_i0.p1 GENE.NODE_3700_length_1174_cov_55.250238_g3515_i0~~NODE_3700_length_1174_cov_55.250238_g3515_i0.p1  ORF type:complete len:353 (+),score=82.15 NODE_3700_length_1174_cov_55.250238_g3515_i0:63-1061(+)
MSAAIKEALERLDYLKSAGLLTEEAFQVKKKEVVDGYLNPTKDAPAAGGGGGEVWDPSAGQQWGAGGGGGQWGGWQVANTGPLMWDGKCELVRMGPGQHHVMCAVHNRARGVSNMRKAGRDGDGNEIWCCKPTQLCKGGGAELPMVEGAERIMLEADKLNNKPLPTTKVKICANWQKGNCGFGDKCHFAHGEHEIGAPHPGWPSKSGKMIPASGQMQTKSKMCRDMKEKGSCPRGSRCTFAHTAEEFGQPTGKMVGDPVGPGAARQIAEQESRGGSWGGGGGSSWGGGGSSSWGGGGNEWGGSSSRDRGRDRSRSRDRDRDYGRDSKRSRQW